MSKEGILSLFHKKITLTFILSFTFFCLGLIAILRHGMWLDELQAWTIARDNVSLLNLLTAIKYDGHPALWYILLYAITRFTHNPVSMQILHLFIATLNIFIFTKFSPFPRWQKILFIFGYYPLYKYALFSRHYGLGILFIFLFCALFKYRHKKYIILSLILLFLCHTNILGLIIAICFGFTLFLENLFSLISPQLPFNSRREMGIGLSIFILGAASSIWQLIPPPDSIIAVGWRFSIELDHIAKVILTAVSNGYFPFINQIIKNQSLLIFISCISLLFFSLVFSRAPIVLLFYLSGSIGLLTFFYAKYLGYIHHHGYLFIILVASLWMANNNPNTKAKNGFLPFLLGKHFYYPKLLVTAILVYHSLLGIYGTLRDGVYPFSAVRETAQFIKDNRLENRGMVGDSYVWVSPITGYLDKRIYYPSIDRFGSYVIWNFKRAKVNEDELIEKGKRLMLQKQEDVLLILNYRLKATPIFVEELKEFTKASNQAERYYLYLMKYNKAPPP